jgi:AraC-like DNA-binding protein
MKRPDRHNEIELNLLEFGSVTYLLGGRKVTVESGRLTVFWAAIPHQVIGLGGGGSYLVATVPLARFLQWGLPDQLVNPILHGEIVSERGIERMARDASAMERWRSDLQKPTQEKQRVVLLEMQARLLRLGMGLSSETTRRASQAAHVESQALSKAEEIACYLAKHYQHPLTTEAIGSAVGLHPNYAMTLFKTVFVTTLTEYLTQQRLSHAQRLLVTTQGKILDIAMASGFGSVSRFNDVFRKAFGCSPRTYRAEHRIRL